MQRADIVLSAALSILIVLVSVIRDARGDHPGTPGEQHRTRSVCRGFVVLPNGHAVLSGAPGAHHQPGHRQAHSEAPAAGTAAAHQGHSHGSMEHRLPAAAPRHLAGYTHGQEIVPQEDMLCVPVGSTEALAWQAVSQAPGLSVRAESRRATLAHNSRANEALTLTLRQGETPIDQARVRLVVRMPHHDHRTPGGHGPANDPDVQGLLAQALSQGRYEVPAVDFTMPGPWLFEVQVQVDDTIYKAYFAAEVGEE